MSIFTRQSGIGVNKDNEYNLPASRPRRTLKREFEEHPLPEQQPVAPLRRPFKDPVRDFDYVSQDMESVEPIQPEYQLNNNTTIDTQTGSPLDPLKEREYARDTDSHIPSFPKPNRYVADHAVIRKVLTDEQCAEVMSWKTNPNYTKVEGLIAGQGLDKKDPKFDAQKQDLLKQGYNLEEVNKWEKEYRVCQIYNDERATKGVIPDDSILNHIIGGLMHFNDNKYQFNIGGVLSPEWPTLFEYNVGGHYGWHTDMFYTETTPIPACRKLSMSVFLNQVGEDYEGGAVEFMGNLGIVEANKGDCIVFPAYMTHRVLPVTKGQRNVIVGWLHGESFK